MGVHASYCMVVATALIGATLTVVAADTGSVSLALFVA